MLTRQGRLYPPEHCRALLQRLLDEVDWQHDYFAFGRRFDVPRLQAWYADPGVNYRYSNNLLEHKDWIAPLLDIKGDIERSTGYDFNSVLVTYYRDGGDHVTLHADDEPELGGAPVIASLSLGATRVLEYRPKAGGDMQTMTLSDGELLVMEPVFQRDWLHGVPLEPAVTAARINLTYRKVYPTDRAS